MGEWMRKAEGQPRSRERLTPMSRPVRKRRTCYLPARHISAATSIDRVATYRP